MDPDDLKEAWRTQASQTRLTIDADHLVNEVRRKQRQLAATIFWRDVREVGTALLMVPVWIYMGTKMALPWTWYLTVPVLLWIAGFMLVDRLRQKRRAVEPADTLRHHLETSLAEVDHQIWLLRNVFWWYLLPPSLSILAFFAQVTWQMGDGGWFSALFAAVSGAGAVLFVGLLYGGIYWLNQFVVRRELVPRRHELAVLLADLQDEVPSAS